MNRAALDASLDSVRRLAVTKQHLQGTPPRRVTTADVVAVVRDLGYVQWDPVTVVAPSHMISLWSRLPGFRPADLERLLWEEKRLFEHWIPVATLVLTEDYPLFDSLMKRYPGSLSKSWGAQGVRAQHFLDQHPDLRAGILERLRGGPRRLSELGDRPRTKRKKGEWSFGSDLSQMLYHLHMRGDVMVVGHQGNQNLWGLSDEFLPSWTPRGEWSEDEFERHAAQRAIRALGTATPSEVNFYFVRGRYHRLERTLATLEEESTIVRVNVEGMRGKEPRYVHTQDVSLLESIGTKGWRPRMTLLPPFDNMVCSQVRTKKLFGFDYVREQFLPAEKRRFGTYVVPILWGEKFIGRIDPRLDKESGTLVINAVHAEADAPRDLETGARVAETIQRFAESLGATSVRYTTRVPAGWKRALH